MHLRCAEAGFLGPNAIVAGGIPMAAGAAFNEKFANSGNVVVCFFGDGAINQGAFHEACNLAGAWHLPLIMFLENNQYAVATAAQDACAVEELSLRASAYGMDAHVVDGNDPAAIYYVVKEAVNQIHEDGRPCLIEAKCYRRYHHAGDLPGSAYNYRSKEEEHIQSQKETVDLFPDTLVASGVLGKRQAAQIKKVAVESVARAVDACTISGSPRKIRTQLYPDPDFVGEGVRSNGQEWETVTFSERGQFSSFRELRYSDAIAAVTEHWLQRDSRTFVLGEDVANFGGGAYGATKDLPARFPGRVLNTPISEAGFVGLGLGAAMTGMRPVVEIMFPDFSLVAADQLFNQIGKARHMYGNTTDLPLVVRTRVATGCGYGGQHSMNPAGLYALFPGWRIVAPANAFDYIGLFNSAMQSLDPVLILEHHSLYSMQFPVPIDVLDYFVMLDKARVQAQGSDVTLISYSSLAGRCEALLDKFREENVSVELIDLRTIDYCGIDYQTIGKSIAKTHCVVIAEETPESQSLGPTIAKNIMTRFFDDLDGPVACLTSQDVPPQAVPGSEVPSQDVLPEDVCPGHLRAGRVCTRLLRACLQVGASGRTKGLANEDREDPRPGNTCATFSAKNKRPLAQSKRAAFLLSRKAFCILRLC